MSFLKAALQFIKMIISKLWQLLCGLLSFFFGSVDYKAPSWMKWCGTQLLTLRNTVYQKPTKSLGVITIIAALGIGAWQGLLWYQARPQPVTVKVTVKVPTRTVIEENLPPNPLVISFDHSEAPIELVGKVATDGITVMPKIIGEWKWSAENELTFQPKADWPVGEKYLVSFSKKAFTPKTLLNSWELEFTAPEFTASIANSEFYQDLINPAMKKAVVNLNFSHPVDAAKLEKSIILKMRSTKKVYLILATPPFHS